MPKSWCYMRNFYFNYGLKLYETSRLCGSTIVSRNAFDFLKCYSYSGIILERSKSTGDKTTVKKKDTSGPLPQSYTPEYVESGWYEWWENQGYFTPTCTDEGEKKRGSAFVLVLPPPNVTGSLHLGHAVTNSIQDAIVRWHRMRGRDALWVPGCDHAGIATQVVVERKLWQEQKMTRHDLGRGKFIEEVWKWKNSKGEIIYEQMKRLGSSLDWSRASFTMDTKLSKAVVEAFVRLHDAGLIYRKNRLVNWSCSLRSTISDIEVDSIALEGRTLLRVPGYDRKIPFGVLTTFAYPIDGSDEEIQVATTRPETMLGDVAVAVHPDDPRYTHLHSSHVVHPITNQRLPVICDTFVDMDFGTGAVKITPAHDHNDLDIGIKHSLDLHTVINDEGQMINVPEPFQGMRRFEARHNVIKMLKGLNLFRGEESHAMNVPICSRSQDVVEPMLKEQWFVDCQDMARKAVQVVEAGQLELIPSSHQNVWFEWLNTIKDWCISRQLWWGHRIPAYKVTNKSGLWVSGRSEQEARGKAAELLDLSEEEITLQQDEDVLDTWFSSALFPFSVFGWPDQTPDLDRFYPTSLLETGSDILFFWVARMVMMGTHLTGRLPFNQVLLHGILRDSQGRKMSKSLGNVIDPMDVIQGRTLQKLHKQLELSNLDPQEIKRAREGQRKDFPQGIPQCGADALRFTLCSYDLKAGEINMDVTHSKSNRHFCNKIWQAFRFIQSHLGPQYQPDTQFQISSSHSATDRWILSRLSHMVRSCDDHFRVYNLHLAVNSLHQFWLTEFCDIYLECVKPVLHECSDSSEADSVRDVLYLCVDTYLRALSPFMPYITEELYQRLPTRADNSHPSVCVAPYPRPEQYPYDNSTVEETMKLVRDVAHHCQSVRKQLGLTKVKAATYLVVKERDELSCLREFQGSLQTLSRASSFSITPDTQPVPPSCLHIPISHTCQLAIDLHGTVDRGVELSRLRTRVDKLQADVLRLTSTASSDLTTDKKRLDKMNNLRNQLERTQSIVYVLEQIS